MATQQQQQNADEANGTTADDASTANTGIVYPDPNNPYKCISNGNIIKPGTFFYFRNGENYLRKKRIFQKNH